MRAARCLVRLLATALLAPTAAARSDGPPPLLEHPIARLRREPPPEPTFAIRGYVAWISECRPCPPRAVCSPCPPPSIVVSARAREVDPSDPLSSREIRLASGAVEGLRRGAHGRFVLRRLPVLETLAGAAEYGLVSFEPQPLVSPRLVRLDDAARREVVRTAVAARVGGDFELDRLPAPVSLDSAARYLMSEAAREVVRSALAGVAEIHGAELELDVDGERARVLVLATRHDFQGEFVYAVDRGEGGWPVFVHRAAPP